MVVVSFLPKSDIAFLAIADGTARHRDLKGLNCLRQHLAFRFRHKQVHVLLAFLEQVLCPRLQPGQIVILDNLGAHKVAGVRPLVEARGARLIYLPPYSPDFNPIEQAWSKIKQQLRSAKARLVEVLEQAAAEAIALITAENAVAWFRHCGYGVHQP